MMTVIISHDIIVFAYFVVKSKNIEKYDIFAVENIDIQHYTCIYRYVGRKLKKL